MVAAAVAADAGEDVVAAEVVEVTALLGIDRKGLATKIGIGWRPELALAIERKRDELGFVEIVAENVNPRALPQALISLKRRGLDVIPHSISLSLGGAQRPDRRRIAHLNELAERLHSPFVSDHICFVRSGGLESGHLLPVARTELSLKILIENVQEAQQRLHRPLVLENIAYLCDWRNSQMSESEFISRLVSQTGCKLLLDVANLYANAINHHFDACQFLGEIPLNSIEYVHVAGGLNHGDAYHDTHAHPVPAGVYDLLHYLHNRTSLSKVMLERDDHFPSERVLHEELEAIKRVFV